MTEKEEVRVARISAFVIGGVAIVLSIFAQSLNIAFLVALAFAVAASANLPSLLYNLFWKGFNTRGATWAIYGGLITCVVLVIFSPVVSGSETSLFTGVRLVVVPAVQPGHHLDPGGLLPRLARQRHLEGAGGRGGLRRARGPVAHRRRIGARPAALTPPL